MIRFHKHKKAQNRFQWTKIKNMYKNIYEEKSYLLAYLPLVLLIGSVFMILVLLVLLVPFRAFLYLWNLIIKLNKKFKTVLMTLFILLRKLILLQAWIFLMTIFFNHHNILNNYNTFKSSHYFLICDTIFVKIAQSINSII